MLKPQFTVQVQDQTDNFCRFVIEPLPKGFGDTLGNSLRRVLYTAIPGAAITSVHIAGVNHQFTSLIGLREDIVQLILNLKLVRFSYSGDKPAKITLEASGPGQITAGDISTPPDVKIVNPKLVIANLADKSSKLEFEATVETGLGYSPAEDRKSTTLGVIPLDATFSPVTLVNYKVESTRVGRVTDYDKLILDITNDQTVSPDQTLKIAAQTLVDYFTGIVNPDLVSVESASAVTSGRPVAGSNISVEELDLPTRIANALQKAGLQTVADLLAVTKTQLSKVKNLGGKSVEIVESALSERGFNLAQ
jgi:DNA-directed RNA polymerase subunit alpha